MNTRPQTTDLVYSGFGVLLFSGYILYDTSMIMKRLSPDEWVMAVVSLYLDAINVFLFVLLSSHAFILV